MEETALSLKVILGKLKTQFIGQKIISYPTLPSTMEAARREANWGAPAGTVILTDEQTSGIGRLQRTWISPRGGLAFSLILRPNLDFVPYLIMLASLAVVYSIQAVTGLKPSIKWPNDILVHDRKVCGILIENDIRRNVLHHAIIGIGINVNLRISDYPEIVSIATSLSDQLGKEVSRLALLCRVLEEMEELYLTFPQTDAIFTQWKKHLITLGQKVTVNMGDTVYKGTAESVHKDGSLALRQKDGRLVKIIAGDVNLK